MLFIVRPSLGGAQAAQPSRASKTYGPGGREVKVILVKMGGEVPFIPRNCPDFIF